MKWAKIKGFEGYEVSDSGQVRSFKGRHPRILKFGLTPNGYHKVILRREGRSFTCNIHRLVAEAFLGPCPDGQEVCHGPLGRNVNSTENLYYGTHRRNVAVDQKRDHQFSSQHPGVSWNKSARKWRAHIKIEGKQHYLGSFDSEIEAASAYQQRLKSYDAC